jgi:cytochrome c
MRSPWLVAVLAAGLSAGCPDSPPACITVDTTCAPLYPPTFDNVYAMTLQNTCGSQQASCHSAVGLEGGLSFQDPQHAYAALLAGRVMPGNPGCSLMIVRIDSPGASYQMPPGEPLSEPERCALIQWVLAGAPGSTGVASSPGGPGRRGGSGTQ